MNGDAVSDSVHYERGYNKGIQMAQKSFLEIIKSEKSTLTQLMVLTLKSTTAREFEELSKKIKSMEEKYSETQEMLDRIINKIT